MKLEDKDVRFIYLPPMTVDAAFASGEGCLDKTSDIVNRVFYGQGFEETLNLYNFIQKHNTEMNYLQLDLLFPIKEKENG